MGHKRLLGLGILVAGLSTLSTASANPPVMADHVQHIQEKSAVVNFLRNTTMVTLSSVQIRDQGYADHVYSVIVHNPTASDVDVDVNYRGKATPGTAKAKSDTEIRVVDNDPDLDNLCNNIGRKVGFRLSTKGPTPIDTKEYHFEWTGTPVFATTMHVGSGLPVSPDGLPRVWAKDPTTVVSPYVCGKTLKAKFKVENDTGKTVQGLKVRLTDNASKVLGTTTVGALGAKSSKIVEVETDDLKGRVQYSGSPWTWGSVTATITDPQNELGPTQIPYVAVIEFAYNAGIFSLKLTE